MADCGSFDSCRMCQDDYLAEHGDEINELKARVTQKLMEERGGLLLIGSFNHLLEASDPFRFLEVSDIRTVMKEHVTRVREEELTRMAWTRHGYQIVGTVALDPRTRPDVVRCGGPRMCQQCKDDVELLGGVMADKDIPPNPLDGVTPLTKAKMLVYEYVKARLEKTDTHVTFSDDEVYVVWFSKTLQNWKALVSTMLPDGMYYEVTYNGDKRETYIDAYKKFDNVVVHD
jgi:hypothetical protein